MSMFKSSPSTSMIAMRCPDSVPVLSTCPGSTGEILFCGGISATIRPDVRIWIGFLQPTSAVAMANRQATFRSGRCIRAIPWLGPIGAIRRGRTLVPNVPTLPGVSAGSVVRMKCRANDLRRRPQSRRSRYGRAGKV